MQNNRIHYGECKVTDYDYYNSPEDSDESLQHAAKFSWISCAFVGTSANEVLFIIVESHDEQKLMTMWHATQFSILTVLVERISSAAAGCLICRV